VVELAPVSAPHTLADADDDDVVVVVASASLSFFFFDADLASLVPSDALAPLSDAPQPVDDTDSGTNEVEPHAGVGSSAAGVAVDVATESH
jgi:hypothetical protein